MASVDFPLSSSPGRLPAEGEGQLINTYIEKRGEGAAYWRRTPGLAVLAAAGATGMRGMMDSGGTIYAAYAGAAVVVPPGGSGSQVGSIPGSAGVTWARNNRADGPDIVAVREDGGAYVVTASGVSAYPGTNLPPNVNSVAFLGGFLIFTVPDGRIFASELNSTDQNALSFASAESSPDGLVRGIVSAGTFYAMGTDSIEPWLNVGSQPFPLLRGTSVIPVGLLTLRAVAGFEAGWGRNVLFVANDKTVRELTGYTTRIVSSPDVEAFLAASTVSTIEASVHTFAGHAIFTLSSDKGSWAYDVTTGQWHQRLSAGASRWRASCSVWSNSRWVFGDTLSGNLLALTEGAFTEAGGPLTATFEGILGSYPSRFAVPQLFMEFTATDDVSAVVSWSFNGGVTYGNPVTRALLPDALAGNPVKIDALGQTSNRGMRVRIAITDPAEFSFMGAAVPDPEPRVA